MTPEELKADMEKLGNEIADLQTDLDEWPADRFGLPGLLAWRCHGGRRNPVFYFHLRGRRID